VDNICVNNRPKYRFGKICKGYLDMNCSRWRFFFNIIILFLRCLDLGSPSNQHIETKLDRPFRKHLHIHMADEKKHMDLFSSLVMIGKKHLVNYTLIHYPSHTHTYRVSI